MAHPYWPFFDLRVTAPGLELLPLTDEVITDICALAAKGIHDPATMPFGIPWTDEPSPVMERRSFQYYWRLRAELSPAFWSLNFAVAVDGRLVGSTGLFAHDFVTLRAFETGSWLGREFQGRGIGKAMRIATLHVGFLGLAAEWATTMAYADNAASIGVTRSLGYEPNGVQRKRQRDEATDSVLFRMSREYFLANHRDERITVHGVEPCLPMLGLADQ